jgi:NAD dependent epimerase/dehydratase family enzyme
MAATLGKVLGRPALLAAPAFMLKLAMGELSGVLLGSQRALPSELLKAGYDFAYPSIEAALKNLVQ